MNELKIAICGKMRSGKDTVCDYMVDKYGVVPFAFGDKLKEYFHNTYTQVPRNPKPHKAYQLYGQLMREVYGQDFWVDKCFEHIKYIKRVAQNYNTTNSDITFITVITDLRQPNEYVRLREEGYKIIRIVAPLQLRKQRMQDKGEKIDEDMFYHETEQHIYDFDVDANIHNDSTLEDLYAAVDKVMQRLLANKLF